MANKGGGKPSDRRAGKRRDRNQRVGTRVPELGYYLIVTDTEETEKNYFEGLRDSIPAELKDRLVIKVEKAKTVELVERALELANKEPQYRIPWIVFDRDQVKDFDDIVEYTPFNGNGINYTGNERYYLKPNDVKLSILEEGHNGYTGQYTVVLSKDLQGDPMEIKVLWYYKQ